jgi:Zn-dependent peptidase ImmA (M78 family)
MQIPTSFQLGAHLIKVQKDVPLKEAWGEWNNERKLLRLRKKSKQNPESFYYQTFTHELVHAILDTMGREELSRDEGFVDAFSEYLAQAFLTSEGGFGKTT